MKFPNLNPFLGKTSSGGLARYVEGFFMNIGALLTANLLFVLCSLPLITVGPGLIALARICCQACRGEDVSPVRDFFKAFKQNLKAGLLLSITLVPVYLGQYLLLSSALGGYLAQGTGLPSLILFAVGFLGLNCFAMYLLPLLAFLKADGGTVLRNAFLLCFAEGGWSLTGGITAMAVFSLGVTSLPNSLPLFIAIFFSLLTYHWCFFGWKIVDKYVFTPYYEQHPEERETDHYA